MSKTYKIFIILILFLITGTIVWAQPDFQEYSGNQEVKILDKVIYGGRISNQTASQAIHIKEGFTYKPQDSNFLRAKIDPQLVFLPEGNTYADEEGNIVSSPNEGAVVGAINASFDVSPSGAATYTVPIECPQGINGMQPNISLVYNSQGGNGIAGWGVDISGLSAVTRTQKTVYLDSVTSGMSIENDIFVLDGNRLLATSPAGSEYRTEIETYSKITRHTSPDYFEVESKDGTKYKYGHNTGRLAYIQDDISKTQAWFIDHAENTTGQTMTFEYEPGNQYNYISKITYGNNTIQFIYENRPDTIHLHFEKKKGYIHKRLKQIVSKTSSHTYREYNLEYSADVFSRLTKITENTVDNTKYNPTKFTWGEYPNNGIDMSNEDYTSFGQDASFFSVDFDGDGANDIVRLEIEEIFEEALLPGFDGGYTPYFVFRVFDPRKENPKLIKTINIPYSVKHEEDLFTRIRTHGGPSIGSIFGDSKQNIILPYYKEEGGRKLFAFYLLHEDSKEGHHPMVLYGERSYATPMISKSDKIPVYDVADLDNTGKDNIYFLEKKKVDGYYPLRICHDIFRVNSDSLSITNVHIPIQLNNTPTELSSADFNGDGLLDILVSTEDEFVILWNRGGDLSQCFSNENKYSYDFNSSDKPINKIADYTGDGLPDIITYYGDGVWKLCKNNGDKTFTVLKSKNLSNLDLRYDKETNRERTIFLDFNYDGKTDIFISDAYPSVFPNSHTFYWLKSNGDDFELVKKIGYEDAEGPRQDNFVIGDFEGKGRQEILCYGFDCWEKNKEKKWRRYYNPLYEKDSDTGRIIQITDGLYNQVEIAYAPLTDNEVYTKQNNAVFPVFDIQAPLYVTQKVKSDIDTDFESTTKYTYEGAKAHAQGRGFLGFNKVIIENEKHNTKNIAESDYDRTYFYPSVSKQFNLTCDNDTISKNESRNQILSLGEKRIAAYPQIQISTNKLTSISSTTMIEEVDNYGNPTKIKKATGGLTEIQDIVYTNNGSWCDNKPSQTTTSLRWDDGENIDSLTRSSIYEYNHLGILTKETTDPETEFEITTEYSDFNTYGQAQTITVTAKDQTPRISKQTYLNGRFVASKIDHLGDTIKYDWDELRGLLKKETTRLGSTSYEYDGFGNLNKTTYPDGRISVQALKWADNNAPGEAKFYKYSQSSGEAPSYVWFDKQGRELRRESYGLNKQKIWVDTEYNNKGQVYRVSEPYFPDSLFIWAATYEYDDLGRKKEVETPMGITNYQYNRKTTTVSSPTGTKETTINNVGWTVSEKTNGKEVVFTHCADGQLKTATPEGGQSVRIEYDLVGNRTRIIDPDAGTITSKYDSWGQVLWEKQLVNADSITTSYDYHPSGLLNYSQIDSERTHYEYDSLHRLRWVGITGKHSQSYTYDYFDRIVQTCDTIENNKVFVRKTEYDQLGRIHRETYPSGYQISNLYDHYGYLTGIVDNQDHVVWKVLESNAKGQLTRTKAGQYETVYSYDAKNFLTNINTQGLLDQSYTYDDQGNMKFRSIAVNINGTTTTNREVFEYDSLYRLTDWNIIDANENIIKAHSINYHPNQPNIAEKSDFGIDMEYGGNGKPHALASYTSHPDLNYADQEIQYTDFKKVKSILEGDNYLAISYGVDKQRTKSVLTTPNKTLTRYYLGNYEEEIVNGKTRNIHYINGGNGLAALFIQTDGEENKLYYTHTDFQGNLIALSNPDGTFAERYAYDPWGKRRNPDNWQEEDTRTEFIIHRGYTLHEHLDEFRLINMNGRVYDPYMGMFLSPDPYIQAPENWLNYNRYSYCLNNPLQYTDPSGEFAWFVPVIIGAVAGAYTGASIQSGTFNFTKWDSNAWQGAIAGGLIGAAAGGLFSAAFVPGGLAGATTTSSFQATGILNAAGEATKAWGITSSIINSSVINIVKNSISGGGWDGAWKAGLVGAATGAWTATGGFGMAKGFGSSNTFAQLGGKLGYQMVGTAGGSIGNSWASGKKPFSQVSLGVGPVNLTLGKGQKLLQWQNNLGNIITNTFGLTNLMLGGKAKPDWKNLSMLYTGGTLEDIYSSFNTAATGIYSILGGPMNIGDGLHRHELHHLWQSRSMGDGFFSNYLGQWLSGSLIDGDGFGRSNWYENQAYGHFWY
ncbi:FG-GAP-like repeat-containing protein [Bacteroidales bacterium OttesenSCG-928-M11]|nr:FG-GAP-like repeat-containing protein [Bacteroidales bacterium OttesenSCG-928-M11]